MTFGQRVRIRREELHMTQEELAVKLGYKSRTSINKIELDKRNMKQSQIVSLAKALETTPAYLMGWDEQPDLSTLQNVSVPAVHSVPILGEICCGDGIFCEENHEGYFFVDNSLKADFCVSVRGDSMTGAGIHDGDKAFLKKDFDFEDGKVYAVLKDGENLVYLRKVYKQDEKIVTMPCNNNYSPEFLKPYDVKILGRLVGVYHEAE